MAQKEYGSTQRLTMKDSGPHRGHGSDRRAQLPREDQELSASPSRQRQRPTEASRAVWPQQVPRMCQVQEGGTVLSAGPSACPLICHTRTQQVSRGLHTPAQGPTTHSVPSAVVSLTCPQGQPVSLLPEAPPAGHPLPSRLGLALGPELWRVFADGQPRLTKAPAWGCPWRLPTGVPSDSPRDGQTHW